MWDSNKEKNPCLFKQTPIPAKVKFYIISQAFVSCLGCQHFISDWLGKQGSSSRAGGFYFSRGFAACSHMLPTRISRLCCSECAWLDKTTMLCRLQTNLQIITLTVSWRLSDMVPISCSPILLTRFKKNCVMYTELSCSNCNLLTVACYETNVQMLMPTV